MTYFHSASPSINERFCASLILLALVDHKFARAIANISVLKQFF